MNWVINGLAILGAWYVLTSIPKYIFIIVYFWRAYAG